MKIGDEIEFEGQLCKVMGYSVDNNGVKHYFLKSPKGTLHKEVILDGVNV